MTRSNRLLNRIILALLGLALVASAAAVWLLEPASVIEPAEITTTGLWITAAALLAVVVLAALWIFSRGRGQVRTLIRRSDDAGAASIESRVVADLIADDLARVPDVLGVTASAYRVRGQVALELRVTTRGAADIRLVVDSVERALDELDDLLETRIPVLLHVASGVRAGFARQQRVR